jgi:hypothetical protein
MQGFEVYIDSSKLQLGAVITQANRPLAFFSQKLSPTQQKYSMTEQELLAIVETLKEFKGMLWGQQLTVYTDHKILMQDALGLTSDQVYRWRLLLEEYGPTTHHHVHQKHPQHSCRCHFTTGLWTRSRRQVNNDDFCSMLVSLHLRLRRKYITIRIHAGIHEHEPGVCQSR